MLTQSPPLSTHIHTRTHTWACKYGQAEYALNMVCIVKILHTFMWSPPITLYRTDADVGLSARLPYIM